MKVCLLLGTHFNTYICNTCNVDKFKMIYINVRKRLNQCIQPDETTCRKANVILGKGNPS